MNSLPLDIINNIKTYNTIKKENNISSNNFLIILKSGILINKEIENEIIYWISINIQNFLIEDYNEYFYINFIYDNFEDDDDDNNEIKILLRFDSCTENFLRDNDEIICIKEYPIIDIHPKIILEKLTNEHKYINKIGISGISDELMKDLWWNMIGEKDGYMTYNSYCINIDGIMNMRESSYNFGWSNYPPKN